ncbi:MAG: hypothetical protein PHE25_02790 [Candidatus Gracilibacteria bacterium]|nr:hypothetical protein [Candidatus Gracilibacteria bacterium]
MKVIFTNSFNKKLSKISSILKEDIIYLLKKYPNTNNLVLIDDLGNSKILKGYLLSKKIRILVLFQNVKSKIIPVSVIKKETSKGKNITKENYIDLFLNDIEKSIKDLDNNNFEEIIISQDTK